jgi:NADH:ubiquinone oxidoreductase subunit
MNVDHAYTQNDWDHRQRGSYSKTATSRRPVGTATQEEKLASKLITESTAEQTQYKVGQDALLSQMQKGRDKYIEAMTKAQRGIENSIFKTGQPGYLSVPLSASRASMGSGLVSGMGTPQGQKSDMEKMVQDKLSAQFFSKPGIDILSHRRRIETPHAYSHHGIYGF